MGKVFSPAKINQTYFKPIVLSIGLHLSVLAAMFFGWDSAKVEKPVTLPRHINAVVVDVSELPSVKKQEEKKRKELEKKKLAEIKKAQEKKKQERLKKKREAEQKKALARKKAAERKRKLEKEKALQLKKKKEEERKKKEKQRREALEKQKEKERIEKAKKEKEIQKRKAEEKKKAQEEQLLKAMREAEEARLVREAEAEEARRREEEARQQALSAQAAADAKDEDRYSALIFAKVKQKWHKPPSAVSGMQVKIRLTLTPTGELVKAQIVGKSGNQAFDQSALSAVHAVGKFPVPDNRRLFESRFRQFTLLFNPKEL